MDQKRLNHLKHRAQSFLNTSDGDEFLELIAHLVGIHKKGLVLNASGDVNLHRLMTDTAVKDFYLDIVKLKNFKGESNE